MSATHRLLRFGVFELNLDTEELRKDGISVKLGPQPFKVLAILAGRSGQIVTREEIRQEVWGDETYVDFEHGLNQCIKQIRNALNENTGRPLYIETLPRKGYRFLAPVTSKTVPVVPKVTASSSGIQPRVVPPALSVAEGGATAAAARPAMDAAPQAAPSRLEDAVREAVAAEKTSPPPAKHGWIGRRIGWLAVPLLAVIAIAFYWHSQKASALTDKDTIVLADFANNTSDPVFDDTLKTALGLALRQSPFLNVLPESKVIETLKMMTLPRDAKLTPDVTREVCERTGSAAFVTGSIVRLGNQYVLELKAVNCQNGDPLAQEQITADSKEEVLNALGGGVNKLRHQLGESLATVQKFDVPLAQATTSSLEALKAFSLSSKASHEKGFAAGIPYAQKAIELDPNFAMAYYQLGGYYFNSNQPERAKQYFSKAFELRDHASERERLIISGTYYYLATGELEKAAQTYQEAVDDYPRDRIVLEDLSLVYGSLGDYEKALDAARQMLQMAPPSVGMDDDLVTFLMASQQFQPARELIQDAEKRQVDSHLTHAALYALSFIAADSATAVKQLQWFASKPSVDTFGLSLESDTEAYAGRLGKASQLTEKAVDSAVRADNAEEAATWRATEALRDAAFGSVAASQQAAAEGLKLAPNSLAVRTLIGLGYAISGDATHAESLAANLNQSYPLDTQVQTLWVPAIQAQLAINHKNPTESLNQLRNVVTPIEYGSSSSVLQTSCLYPTYIRGQAYLQLGQGKQAAAEFQKILDHSGLVWNCWTGALAHLGAARANYLEAKSAQASEADAAKQRALNEYQQFLTLWKDADPDIPILQQAKAEYASLQ